MSVDLSLIRSKADFYLKLTRIYLHFSSNIKISLFELVMQNECGAILTSPSKYITSIDANGDGLYDSGQDCLWTIMLGSTKVIVFEVLKQDIYQPAKSSKCEDDFLQVSSYSRTHSTYL